MSNHLELLKSMTTVVSDTGDIGSIERYKPQDATTNPSLILKAATLDAYTPLVDQAVSFAMAHSNQAKERLKLAGQKLAVNFGCAILKIIPGRVSTEVDARLSFDIQASCQQARELVALYKQEGVDASRVLIKLASTWEGIEAAKILEKEGVHCNLTLMFNLAQAVACAQSGVFLISPFVGRIYDWYKAHENRDYTQEEDPGVQSVKTIYDYLRKFNYPTIVMGASFRNVGQIIELAGCDYLTISPSLLEELQRTPGKLKRVLTPQLAQTSSIEKLSIDEKRFRWMMNDDPMATEKLAEGIRIFAKDIYKMEKELLLPRLG